MQALSLATLRACYWNKGRKIIFQLNITWLKNPTGRRQTSWLFYKVGPRIWPLDCQETNPPSGRVEALNLEHSLVWHQFVQPVFQGSLPPGVKATKLHCVLRSCTAYIASSWYSCQALELRSLCTCKPQQVYQVFLQALSIYIYICLLFVSCSWFRWDCVASSRQSGGVQ